MDPIDILKEMPFLQSLPEEIRSLVLNLILLVIALIIIWILRHLITWSILRPLRSLAQRSRYDIDEKLLDALVGPIRFAIVALGIILTINMLDFGPSVKVLAETIARTMVIIAVFYAVYTVFNVLTITPNTLLRLTGITIPERLLPFLRTLTQIIIIALAIVIILQEWSYDVTGLIASLGIVGLAGALAAQDTISNMFGFTAIISDNSFEVGDFIKTPDVTGVVEHVGIRSTNIRQLDQAIVTVPNSKLTNAAITNWSRLEKRRLNFTLGMTYDSSPKQMRALLQQIRELLESREHVDNESIVVHFTDFSDSSLDIFVACYIMLPVWGEFTAEKEPINLAIIDIIDELGMSIAFPSQSLYVEALPGQQRESPFTDDEIPDIPLEHDAIPQQEGTGDTDDQISDQTPESE